LLLSLVIVTKGRGLWAGAVAVRFPTRDVDIIYYLNNQYQLCPVSSAGWRVVIQWPEASEFDSRCEHSFLNMIKFFLIK
jgi:hypothetical protein